MRLLFLNQDLRVVIWDVFIKLEIMNMIFIWNLTIAPIHILSGSILEFKILEKTELIPFILKTFKNLILFTIWVCFHWCTQERRRNVLEMDGIEMAIMFAITKILRKRKTRKAKITFIVFHSIFDSDMILMRFTLPIAILILTLIWEHLLTQSVQLKIETELEKQQCAKH